ncbi:DUF4839 domain-containing protein [Streptomyces longwoodensis]|uniref:DUF4839 domain-containing protein n=1 Tax=Streptomyces longwoodensis TaxID=68231 RepID=UPI0033FBC18A
MADEIKYERKTVQTVRGTDSLVISRMQKDGWELVEQSQGALRSTLTFRRPKKQPPWRLFGAATAVLVLLTVVIGVGSALSGGDEEKGGADKLTAPTGDVPSSTPARATSRPTSVEVITPENDAEFAALLKADRCDDANVTYATGHGGRIIAFDGSVVHMASHGKYKTRYDLLLAPGDEGPDTTVGPSFKFEDVNMADLKLVADRAPATIGAGDKFHFVAEVGEFNAAQCLFFLHPITTSPRQ